MKGAARDGALCLASCRAALRLRCFSARNISLQVGCGEGIPPGSAVNEVNVISSHG